MGQTNLQEKIKIWIKNRNNQYLLAILLISFIIRIYYFFLTKNQALWYDEADYLNMARMWSSGLEWPLAVVRPVLMAFIFYLFYSIGLGELTFRILILSMSLAAIFLLYLVGKEMFNEKVGLISSFMLAFFWSFTFFSFRILVDVAVVFFWLFATYCFFKYYGKNDKKLWTFGLFLGLGFLTKFTVALLGFVILIFLLFTEKLKFIKNKNLWIAFTVIIIIVAPFLFYEYVNFGHPLAFYIKVASTPQPVDRTFLQSFTDFAAFSVPLVGTIFFILFIIGLFSFSKFVLCFDLFIKRKDKSFDNDFFLLLWLVIPFLYIVKIGYGYYIEERWLFMFYPALFIVASRGTLFIYNSLKKYSVYVASAIIVLILLFGAYQNMQRADLIINDKANSNIQLKQAGEWLASNSESNEKIITTNMYAELQYHSNRQVINMEGSGEEYFEGLMKQYNPRYFVVSLFFPLEPLNITSYIQSHQDLFIPVQQYNIEQQGQQYPIVTILQINETARLKYGLSSIS